MSTRKTNQTAKKRTQESKNPMTVKETVERMTVNVLTAIRQYEPEEQNDIIEAIISEIGIDRVNRESSLSAEFSNAKHHAGRFFNMVNGKIIDEKLSIKAQNGTR